MSVLAELRYDGVGMGSVVDDAERIDEVVGHDGDERGELFGVAGAEADSEGIVGMSGNECRCL